MPWDFWLIFFLLGLLVPWRGYVRLKKILARPAIDSKEKLALYGWTIASQWVMTGVVAWRALARGLTPRDLGLAQHLDAKLVFLGAGGAIALGTLHWLNLRRVGRMEGPMPERMRTLALRILPRTPVETLPYAALAVTAGVCEEFLYRGFAMAVLFRVGLATWAVVPLTALFFGVAHAYQGRPGIAGTTLMGVFLGIVRVAYVNLIPVMLMHTVVDLVAGIAGPKYLMRKAQEV